MVQRGMSRSIPLVLSVLSRSGTNYLEVTGRLDMAGMDMDMVTSRPGIDSMVLIL